MTFKTGFCQTGNCDRCPHEIKVHRVDKQGRYDRQWTCACLCHTEKGLPW